MLFQRNILTVLIFVIFFFFFLLFSFQVRPPQTPILKGTATSHPFRDYPAFWQKSSVSPPPPPCGTFRPTAAASSKLRSPANFSGPVFQSVGIPFFAFFFAQSLSIRPYSERATSARIDCFRSISAEPPLGFTKPCFPYFSIRNLFFSFSSR